MTFDVVQKVLEVSGFSEINPVQKAALIWLGEIYEK